MCLEDKRIEFEAETDTGAGGDSRRRTRIGDRTGMRHRRGQGIRHGVRADPAGAPAGQQGVGRGSPTRAVTDLADQLTELEVDKVTVESTSDYWRIRYYLLEATGLDVQLVNARAVKKCPAGPKPTNATLSGWPSSPKRGCCGPHSCRPRRSDSCACPLTLVIFRSGNE